MTETSEDIQVTTQSDVEVACRVATGQAGEAGFSASDIGELVIVVSELGTNLLRHATGGHLTISRKLEGTSGSVLVVSRDSGPGIPDIERALQDGHGKAGGMGAGLGAIRRLSDNFDIASTPSGTIVRATKNASPTSQLSVGVAQKCHPREAVNGDGWVNFSPLPGQYRVGVIDGAGHGQEAAEAARRARDEVIRSANAPLPATFERCHAAMKGTRGAVMSLAAIDLASMRLEIAGVGNVESRIQSADREQQAVMQRGMLGASAPRVRPLPFTLVGDWALVLYSDGVKTRFSVTDYTKAPGPQRTASELAAAILDEWVRGEDDATVLVMRPGAARTID